MEARQGPSDATGAMESARTYTGGPVEYPSPSNILILAAASSEKRHGAPAELPSKIARKKKGHGVCAERPPWSSGAAAPHVAVAEVHLLDVRPRRDAHALRDEVPDGAAHREARVALAPYEHPEARMVRRPAHLAVEAPRLPSQGCFIHRGS